MPTRFLENFGETLGEKWVANLLTPAFVFWFGGVFAWINRFGWSDLQQQFTQLAEPLQFAVLIGILLIVTTSGFVIQRFDLAVLRFFEGYWHPWLNPIRDRFVAQQQRQFDRLDQQWQKLQNKQGQSDFTTVDREQLIALDWQLRQFPFSVTRLCQPDWGTS